MTATAASLQSFAMPAPQNSYDKRHGSRISAGLAWAVAVHLLAAYFILSGGARSFIKQIKKPMEAVVIQEVMIPPPPPPPPKNVEPKPEAPKSLASPTPFVPPTEIATPVATAAPVIQSAATPPVTPHVVVATPPPPPPTPADAAPNTASLEAEYGARLRAAINANKRYPTGRQASQTRPQGMVKLWFVLTRAGALVDVGVIPTDAHYLLEDAAKASVRRSVFPPFPAHTWLGEEQHKFVTEVEFVPPSSNQ